MLCPVEKRREIKGSAEKIRKMDMRTGQNDTELHNREKTKTETLKDKALRRAWYTQGEGEIIGGKAGERMFKGEKGEWKTGREEK